MKNELNDLFDYGYKIYQNPEYFKFSIDSILLADFININLKDKVLVDFCTGNAPVPIIMSSKISKVYGIEIQKEIFNLAVNSIDINKIDNVKIINDNLKNSLEYFKENSVDIISCNPPYFKYVDTSIINKNMVKSVARHEIDINLEDIVSISYKLLRNKGRLFLVYTSSRCAELIALLNKYHFGVKKLQFCYDKLNTNSTIFLIEAMKDGKNDVKVLNPCILENYRRGK